jgi:hypothetical protein
MMAIARHLPIGIHHHHHHHSRSGSKKNVACRLTEKSRSENQIKLFGNESPKARH